MFRATASTPEPGTPATPVTGTSTACPNGSAPVRPPVPSRVSNTRWGVTGKNSPPAHKVQALGSSWALAAWAPTVVSISTATTPILPRRPKAVRGPTMRVVSLVVPPTPAGRPPRHRSRRFLGVKSRTARQTRLDVVESGDGTRVDTGLGGQVQRHEVALQHQVEQLGQRPVALGLDLVDGAHHLTDQVVHQLEAAPDLGVLEVVAQLHQREHLAGDV